MVGKERLRPFCRESLKSRPVCVRVVEGTTDSVPHGIPRQIRGRDEVQQPLHLGGIIHPFGVFASACHGHGLCFLDDEVSLSDVEPMAKAQKEDACHTFDFTRHSGTATCGDWLFVHGVERGFKHISRKRRHERMCAGEIVIAEVLRQLRAILLETVDNLRREARKRMKAKFRKSAFRKGTDILHASKSRLNLLPFGEYVLRLQDALGELRSVRLFLFGGILPFRLKAAQRLKCLAFLAFDLVEKSKLLWPARRLRPVLEDTGLHDGKRHAAVILRHGYRHAKRIAYLTCLLRYDLEDDTIDRVVLTVKKRTLHLACRLPETVNPALPLLVAGWIPEKVVMYDGIVVTLEVYSLRETVGGNENVLWIAGKVVDSRLAGIGIIHAAYCGYGVIRKLLAESIRHILGRLDVAAEYDGTFCIFALKKIVFEETDEADEFRIVRADGELLGLLLDEFEGCKPISKRIDVRCDVGGLSILEIENARFIGSLFDFLCAF